MNLPQGGIAHGARIVSVGRPIGLGQPLRTEPQQHGTSRHFITVANSDRHRAATVREWAPQHVADTINAELAKRGHACPYFYFSGDEAAGWLDRNVQVPKINSLTLEQWIQEYGKPENRNAEILKSAKGM